MPSHVSQRHAKQTGKTCCPRMPSASRQTIGAVLMTTPLLRSPEYRRLLEGRIAEQRAHWGTGYPLAGRALKLLG